MYIFLKLSYFGTFITSSRENSIINPHVPITQILQLVRLMVLKAIQFEIIIKNLESLSCVALKKFKSNIKNRLSVDLKQRLHHI